MLISSLLVLALLSTFSAGLFYIVNSEARVTVSDLESTQAYYGASAAMEKMVVDLNDLTAGQQNLSVSAVEGLGTSNNQPSFPGVTYSDYSFSVPFDSGAPEVPLSEIRAISAGPDQGMTGDITPVRLSATALGSGGESVKMVRDVEFVELPLFQFAVFSEQDLSFHTAANLDLSGRIHSNGNIFLAAGSGPGRMVFHSRVTGREIIRSELANGISTSVAGLNVPMWIPIAPGGCDGLSVACRELASNEGSKTAGPTSSANVNWTSISESVYHGRVLNLATGAKDLELPFAQSGVQPVDLIRRPPTGESVTSPLGQSRLFNQAQIRVLLNDDPADLPGGTGVQLTNVAPYYDGVSYGATDTAFAEQEDLYDCIDPTLRTLVEGFPEPLQTILLDAFAEIFGCGAGGGGSSTPLIDGHLLVQARQSDSSYSDVTMEWLNLGIAAENANAILRFQALSDIDGDGTPDFTDTATNRRNPGLFSPRNLYDTREGEVRDSSTSTTCALGGVINTIDLDVGNLRGWLAGTTGTTGTAVESVSQNGYLLYFSDRRGMLFPIRVDPSSESTATRTS